MTQDKRRIGTRSIHAGEPDPRPYGAVVMPIFQSANFLFGADDTEELRYIRYNNSPNHDQLATKLASLAAAERAFVTASGMAAISTAILSAVGQGERLLVQRNLYGGTHGFVSHDLPRLGVAVDVLDANDPESWQRALRPETRAFYVETMSNPLLEVPDLERVVSFCREHRLTSIIDNTFASPINFRPNEHGFDLSVASGTKYLNGHSDIVCGAVSGSSGAVERAFALARHLGGALDPHAAFLLSRGLKTLHLRIAQHNRNAAALARLLDEHPGVSRTVHPSLPSHPQHERATRLFGGFGGMLAFELDGDVARTEQFLNRLSIPLIAPSLGSVETLVTRPALTSHSSLDPRERAEIGISDRLVRLSVGCEETDDLLEDFSAALDG